MVAVNDIVYIFGGRVVKGTYYGRSDTIASFNTVSKQWKDMGRLDQKERGASVFVQNDKFIIVGGAKDPKETHHRSLVERCTKNQDKIHCPEIHQPFPYQCTIYGFEQYGYPEMIQIPDDYCQ